MGQRETEILKSTVLDLKSELSPEDIESLDAKVRDLTGNEGLS